MLSTSTLFCPFVCKFVTQFDEINYKMLQCLVRVEMIEIFD